MLFHENMDFISRRGSFLLRRFSVRRVLLIFLCVLSLPVYYAGAHYAAMTVLSNEAHAATRAMAVTKEDRVPSYGTKILAHRLRSNPDVFVKLERQDVLALFDEPVLRRQEGQTHIWQYRSASCVLDIYFAPAEAAEGFWPVVHYELRNRETAVLTRASTIVARATVDRPACLQGMFVDL